MCVCVCPYAYAHAHMHAGVCGSQGMFHPLEMKLQLDVGAQN